MVCNSGIVVRVAQGSADIWQYLACIPEPVSSQQPLDLICCFPLQQLSRLALCLWTFLCLPPPYDSFYFPSYTYYSDSDSDSDSDSTIPLHYHDYYYNSHSD